MAQEVIKSLSEDFVHCTICTEPYNEPKMLPCLHSFCLQCLQQWVTSCQGETFSCPTCRCNVDLAGSGVNELPKNFFLVSLMERLEEVNRLTTEHQDYNCNICRNKMGTMFCLDCKMHICHDCKETHDRLTRSNDHALIPYDKLSDESFLQRKLSSQAPYCNEHKEEKVRYYCTQCRQLACQVCATVNHQGHQSLQEVKSRVATVKAHFGEILEESASQTRDVTNKSRATDNTTEQINREVSELSRQVNIHYEKIAARLQSDRQKLQEELNDIKTKKFETLSGIGNEISMWLRKMENLNKMTCTILEQENPWEILEMENRIVESFERLKADEDRVIQLPIPETLQLGFYPSNLSVLQELPRRARNRNSELLSDENLLGTIKRPCVFVWDPFETLRL